MPHGAVLNIRVISALLRRHLARAYGWADRPTWCRIPSPPLTGHSQRGDAPRASAFLRDTIDWDGVNIRLLLGHTRIATTTIYPHLTTLTRTSLPTLLDRLTTDL